MLKIAIDFDGTLVTADEPPAFRPGALACLAALKRAGHHLILHSCRCNPSDEPSSDDEVARFYRLGEVPPRIVDQWDRFGEMRVLLIAAGAWELFDQVWQAPGKPIADVYIDDRAAEPDWTSIGLEFGEPARVAQSA